jgi:serine protease Do
MGDRTRASLVAVALVLPLAACGGHKDTTSDGPSTSTAATTASTGTTTHPPAHKASTASGSGHDLLAKVGDGVVRISVVGCDEAGSGSGLLVSPTRVLTVHHVVEGGARIAVRSGRRVASARVVADDPSKELALLDLDRPMAGHVFTFNDNPRVGSAAYVLGYPGGRPLSQTAGTVSGLDRRVAFGDQDLRHLVQFDAAAAPGNSGGPLVGETGAVIGLDEGELLDEQNTNYAVSGKTAHAFVNLNRGASKPIDLASCDLSAAGSERLVRVDSHSPEAWDVATALDQFYGAINQRDYETAWNFMTRRMRGAYDGFGDYAEAESTSTILDAHLEVLDVEGESSDQAQVAFASLQDAAHAPKGTDQMCSLWTITYKLRLDSGWWQIDSSRLSGGPPRPCAADQQARYEAQRATMSTPPDVEPS